MVAGQPSRRRYRFAEYTLVPAERMLRRHGVEVRLIPRYLDLLLLLVERRGEALHRREILERVWSDVVVSDGALSQAVRTLRRALAEDGAGLVFIRTVSRHGYQFVCPVVEEQGSDLADVAPAPGPEATAPVQAGPAGDPLAAPLARLLDPGADDEAREEAAVELHLLGTAEALRRLDRQPGHARAWAHLRDSRWDVAGAGDVPLAGAPAGPLAWSALAGLRLRRARRLVTARWATASVGGALAGVVAGLLGALAIAGLGSAGFPSASLALGLCLVGAAVAGLGAAGVGSGLAAGEALVRSRRTLALALLGAAGGGLVGWAARRGVDALLAGLFGFGSLALGGGLEGLAVGAAAGLGYGLATHPPAGGLATPRGAARLRACLATGLACGAAAALLSAGGLRLGAASLAAVVDGFPATQVRLALFGALAGEEDFGPRARTLVGAAEGLLFGAGLAAGLTRRPRLSGS
jgi:DNA-binding winged helix-turn-helix (wHTH) protein